MNRTSAPSAVLYITTGCAHCQAVLDGLARLVKAGKLARLEVINLSLEPETAASLEIRSVPRTRIGDFELEGQLSHAELADWVDAAREGESRARYFAHLLDNRRLDEVIRRVREQPSSLVELLNLLTSAETPMGTRIGVSAVIEALPGSGALSEVIPELEQLTLSELPQTRADACHFLGLTGDRRVIPAVRRLLNDEQGDVREIAMETLALLGDHAEDTEETKS
jgi:hypothetical protein